MKTDPQKTEAWFLVILGAALLSASGSVGPDAAGGSAMSEIGLVMANLMVGWGGPACLLIGILRLAKAT